MQLLGRPIEGLTLIRAAGAERTAAYPRPRLAAVDGRLVGHAGL